MRWCTVDDRVLTVTGDAVVVGSVAALLFLAAFWVVALWLLWRVGRLVLRRLRESRAREPWSEAGGLWAQSGFLLRPAQGRRWGAGWWRRSRRGRGSVDL